MDFSKNIFVGVTCTSLKKKKDHWKTQLKEISNLGIPEIALFPTTLNRKERAQMYRELEKSPVKTVKLVHLRDHDFEEEEIIYFFKKYNTRRFNCHERSFDYFYKAYPRLRKYFLLEPDYDNHLQNKIEPNRMGGFCIDLAHMMAAKERTTLEYSYIIKRLNNTKFLANHLNGYDYTKKRDLHFVTELKQFDYLQSLPLKVFSNVIALELENSIEEQLKFKKYLAEMLNRRFKV